MNRLRNRLILVFVLATLVPLGLTLWTTLSLIDRSLGLAPFSELDTVSRSLEKTGRELYRTSCELLRRDAEAGRIEPRRLRPAEAQAFWDLDAPEQFERTEHGAILNYYVRHGDEVWLYSRPLGVAMDQLTEQIAEAHQTLQKSEARNLRRGFSTTLLLIASALWIAAVGGLVYLAHRISRPVQQLTQGLRRVAAGDLGARVESRGSDEIGAAVDAFNHMAAQLEQARERLIHITRLASWQALARKMAHEVKNSLTPIRLTMEEIVSRRGEPDGVFLEQAAQIVADEVNTLERRVKAFSEFASEPPVMPESIDLNALVEERVSFLRSSHPDIVYQLKLASEKPQATADPDLIKGALTNLLENAADAARPTGTVRVTTGGEGGRLWIEVHDSGPGLSAQARSTLFEPTISFKKGGMGLGLSIARRSALLCGGDIEALDGQLGGAGFRIILQAVEPGVRSQNGVEASTRR